MKGKGKVASWEACCEDARKRERFSAEKARILNELPEKQRKKLDQLSTTLRDDSLVDLEPGSERADEEEADIDGAEDDVWRRE